MSLAKHMSNQLYQLFKDKSDVAGTLERRQDGSFVWHLPHEHFAIRLEFGECDRHSTELHRLQVTATHDAANKDEQPTLQQLANAVSKSLSYLEEPLEVWELEEREDTVQLRSNPPQRDEDEVIYWEASIQQPTTPSGRETTVEMSRYRWQPGMPERELVHYPATFNLLGRIAESLCQTIDD
jgi:hypothetical protein